MISRGFKTVSILTDKTVTVFTPTHLPKHLALMLLPQQMMAATNALSTTYLYKISNILVQILKDLSFLKKQSLLRERRLLLI